MCTLKLLGEPNLSWFLQKGLGRVPGCRTKLQLPWLWGSGQRSLLSCPPSSLLYPDFCKPLGHSVEEHRDYRSSRGRPATFPN